MPDALGILDAPEIFRRLEDSEDPVYLSIDKDVLSPDFARTNWIRDRQA